MDDIDRTIAPFRDESGNRFNGVPTVCAQIALREPGEQEDGSTEQTRGHVRE